MMERVLGLALKLSKSLYVISGIVLVSMMLLTVTDVVLRTIGRPITGAYEMVGFMAAVVIAFGLPYTSSTRGHVYMEFLIERIPKPRQNIIIISTRLIGIALFALAAYNLFVVGVDLRHTGEVSPTLNLPFYPVAYALGVSFFVLVIVLICDIIKVCGGRYE